MNKKGLILVYTGDGKGKTTSAIGLCIRFAGWGKKVCFIQFLKSEDFECGEKLFFKNNNIELYCTGIGYSWTKTPDEQVESLKSAWEFAKSKIEDSSYDIVVLDEINYCLCGKNGVENVIDLEELIYVINNRPEYQNIVLTGRNAKNEIIEIADIVTEMKCIKHPFESGLQAAKGIEY